MEIVQSKTREEFPLSPKKIIKKTIQSVLNAFVGWSIIYLSFGGLAILAAFQRINKVNYWGPGLRMIFLIFGLLFLFFLFIGILVYFYQKWYFVAYYYDFTEYGLVIKKGPITPKEVTIPYENIQDVGIDQDIFDRMFGLFDVHISSANFVSGLEAHIDGVERAVADGLKQVILDRAQKAKIKSNN